MLSEAELVDKAAYEFADTERFIEAGEQTCGPYVWGRYDILLLPPSFPCMFCCTRAPLAYHYPRASHECFAAHKHYLSIVSSHNAFPYIPDGGMENCQLYVMQRCTALYQM